MWLVGSRESRKRILLQFLFLFVSSSQLFACHLYVFCALNLNYPKTSKINIVPNNSEEEHYHHRTRCFHPSKCRFSCVRDRDRARVAFLLAWNHTHSGVYYPRVHLDGHENTEMVNEKLIMKNAKGLLNNLGVTLWGNISKFKLFFFFFLLLRLRIFLGLKPDFHQITFPAIVINKQIYVTTHNTTNLLTLHKILMKKYLESFENIFNIHYI